MINFKIIASPTIGKKIEFNQSIESIKKKIREISPLFKVEVSTEDSYQFSFSFETEEETNKLLESDGFILLAGAIKTLCKKHSLSIISPKLNDEFFDCKNFSKIKDYINNKKGVTYAN